MKNLIYSLGKKSMLPLLGLLLFFSCKKDDSSVDELRYRRYWTKRNTTPPVVVDTTTKPTTGTGTTGTGTTGTGTTGTGTTGTGTGTGTTTGTGTGTTTTTARKNLLQESTFESSEWSTDKYGHTYPKGWDNNQSCDNCFGYSISRSTTYAKAGSSSVRFQLDYNAAQIADQPRAELTGMGENAVQIERWYGGSIYLPSDWTTDSKEEIVVQWHHNSSTGSPPFALTVAGSDWQLEHLTDNQGSKFKYAQIGTIAKGKWTDFVFHIKWSPNSDGLYEVWKDGVKVYTYSGVTSYNLSVYQKLGVYKWLWKNGPSSTSSRVMYWDEFRTGSASATYADVAPGSN